MDQRTVNRSLEGTKVVISAEQVRAELLRFARERSDGATFCPSEAARRLSADWRPLMPLIRSVAGELVDAGLLVCTQGGRPTNPREARGPIRLGVAAD